MQKIVFIDTSVLCNLVPVPGRDSHNSEALAEMKMRRSGDHRFILPITSVIETGNFIAQVPDGGLRRAAAWRMEKMLRLVSENKAPWVLHDIEWGGGFLSRFLDGADTGCSYVEHAVNRLGGGDLCILTERSHYQERSGVRAEIWTMDEGLSAYS